MIIAEVTLDEVLNFREERSQIQGELITSFKRPIISFSMNIAGPKKRTPIIEFAFFETIKRLEKKLGKPVVQKIITGTAGCEAFYVYSDGAEELKRKCVELEEQLPVGRLLDIDVIDENGVKLSRQVERKCLICGEPAFPCARSRRHPLSEITAKTNSMLMDYCAGQIGTYAVQALIDEVRLTPKPGLVDADNNGAHRDMDIAMMEKSARSLQQYFETAARLGASCATACSQKLQEAGIEAEKTMFAVTQGVNTHKGAIFSLGLLCAGAGKLLNESGGDLFQDAALIATGLRRAKEDTHGARVVSEYSAGGARVEALSGFPHVAAAYELLKTGKSELEVLLNLMSSVDDTNVLWRGGREGLDFVKSTATEILSEVPDRRDSLMKDFDRQCIEKWLSPGGSADLLANSLFAYSLPFIQI